MPDPELATSDRPKPSAARLQRISLLTSAAGGVLFAMVALVRPLALWHGYLVAFNFWLGMPLGCLVLVWLHQLTGGGWGWVIRPVQAAAAATMPLLAIALIPIILGLGELYPWAKPEWSGETRQFHAKSQYLNETFFIVRAIAYFAIWIVLALVTNRWICATDQKGDPRAARRLSAISGPAILAYAPTITFAGIDWIMSLEPEWYSTIFSVVYSVGQILAALAFSVIGVIVGMSRTNEHRELAGDAPCDSAVIRVADYLPDLGNLLLAFVMFWAYVAFSQFLLIWAGNLPEEVRWYVSRTQTGWKWVAILLAGCEFGLPFVLLLSRSIKRNPRSLAKVAALILAIHFVDLAWQILPAFSPHDDWNSLVECCAALCATVGLGGLWVAAWLQSLKKMPVYTTRAAAKLSSHND